MADIVNLRRARKRRDQAAEADAAAANRAAHGRTKVERKQTDAARAADRTHLERHRLDGEGDPT